MKPLKPTALPVACGMETARCECSLGRRLLKQVVRAPDPRRPASGLKQTRSEVTSSRVTEPAARSHIGRSAKPSLTPIASICRLVNGSCSAPGVPAVPARFPRSTQYVLCIGGKCRGIHATWSSRVFDISHPGDPQSAAESRRWP